MTRDIVVDCWLASQARARESGAKRVYYLSLEFLIGRLLADVLGNLGLTEAEARDAAAYLYTVGARGLPRVPPGMPLGGGTGGPRPEPLIRPRA